MVNTTIELDNSCGYLTVKTVRSIAVELYVEFDITWQCEDATEQGRPSAELEIRGNCLYDTEAQNFYEIRNSGEKFHYADVDDQQKTKSNFIVHGLSITIGHRDVTHTVRRPL